MQEALFSVRVNFQQATQPWNSNISRAVIKSWGLGIFPGYYECGCWLLSLENRRKIEPGKEIPSCLIPRLRVVFTRQLEILVTTLHKTGWNGNKWHKDGLHTDSNMAYSSKGETTVFEIQTRDICTPTPMRASCKTGVCLLEKSQRKLLKLSKGQWLSLGFCIREEPDDSKPTKIKIIYYIPFGKQ